MKNVVIGGLVVLCIGMGGFIVYDKTDLLKDLKSEEKIIESNNKKEESTDDDSSNDSESSDEYKAKVSVSTKDILAYYKERLSFYDNSKEEYVIENYYGVSDLNNDGIPELLIYYENVGNTPIIAETTIISYDENMGNKDSNYLVSWGTIYARYASWFKMKDGTIMMVSGHMGSESVVTFKVEKNWLVKIKGVINENVDDYTSGDEIVSMKSCSDTSLLDNYK